MEYIHPSIEEYLKHLADKELRYLRDCKINKKKQLFVKFCPYNTKTLSNLINKEVYFSDIFGFNDFNEANFIAPFNLDKFKSEENNTPLKLSIENEIKQIFYEKQFKQELKELNRNPEFIDEVAEWIKNDFSQLSRAKFTEYHQSLFEYIVFKNMGIFCLSNANVFKNTSALLMFAHYADNNRGLALIYEAKKTPEQVKYLDSYGGRPVSLSSLTTPEYLLPGTSKSHFEKFIEIHQGNFLKKADAWQYENEYRLFGKPNLPQQASEHGLELKAIFHTPRFDDLQTLEEINKNMYEGELQIQQIEPSQSDYHFNIIENKSTKASEWIDENL